MGLFYKISEKELLEVRNKILVEVGIPVLNKNGFEQSPLKTSWYGKNNLGDYAYELCRLVNDSQLQIIDTYISKSDSWLQIFLNIFELRPKLKSLSNLNKNEGIKYDLPPNSLTKMRLRADDIKGMPLLDYHFMFGGHKLRAYHTKAGLNRRVKELGNRIEQDLRNIDSFVKRWHELYEPNLVDWEGNKLE